MECTYNRRQNKRGGASVKQRINFIERRQRNRTSIQTISPENRPPNLPVGPNIAQPSSSNIFSIRYPILEPILDSLKGIVTKAAACDMLDAYFRKSAWGNSFLLRKSSILTSDPTRIRTTKATLIYAILCFASQYYADEGSEFLDVSRCGVTDKLFALAASSVVSFHHLDQEASLDDVISHVQLASILSSSKYQKKSIEWWSATYQLARQLRLNEERPDLEISAEEKEERRRTWWLLYCVDRHQALSVRKSLAFRDAESHDLLVPCSESLWTGSEEFSPPSDNRISGITYKVMDCSFFGFIQPLMSILGEIIDLYNFEESGQRTAADVEHQRCIIREHLDTYEKSLSEFNDDSNEAQLLKRYANHTMSTLFILSVAKWDPLDAMADVEQSGLSQDAIYSAAMATIAANNIRDIQQLDPRFEYMPLFFGTFLLQCSFPLLLLMKTFGTQSDQNIIGGCETMLQAYIISSRSRERRLLNPLWSSPYWSNFSSIIDEINESKRQPTTNSPDIAARTMQDIYAKTREILGLFRWNKTGHGVNTQPPPYYLTV